MDAEILKHFIGRNVEVLIGGAWIEGHMKPIVKGQCTLLPLKEAAPFYGPCAFRMDAIQAIREVKKTEETKVAQPSINFPNNISSALDANKPAFGQRFVYPK